MPTNFPDERERAPMYDEMKKPDSIRNWMAVCRLVSPSRDCRCIMCHTNAAWSGQSSAGDLRSSTLSCGRFVLHAWSTSAPESPPLAVGSRPKERHRRTLSLGACTFASRRPPRTPGRPAQRRRARGTRREPAAHFDPPASIAGARSAADRHCKSTASAPAERRAGLEDGSCKLLERNFDIWHVWPADEVVFRKDSGRRWKPARISMVCSITLTMPEADHVGAVFSVSGYEPSKPPRSFC